MFYNKRRQQEMATTRTGATRCPICSRSKNEAIEEQVRKRKGCGCDNCIFMEEIQTAIENKRIIPKPKPRPPRFKIKRIE